MKTVGIWGLFNSRGSGIGKMLVDYLSKTKYKIVGIGRDPSKTVIKNLSKKVAVDLTKKSVDLTKVVSKIGELDVLVVTAGIGYPNPIWDINLLKINEMTKANFILPIWIVSIATQITNHIVLTGSIAGVLQREGSSVYAGTKAGLISFADSARKELQKKYIQTINFNNIHRVGTEKVMKTYEFLINNPSNMDVTIDI